ncbi:MAG: M16 family metallopeptidase [Acidimicrobiia bacterium]
MDFNLTTLPNGLRIISEHMPEVRSAALGCWIDTGSRDETPAEGGSSHYLEHLLFKGSEAWPSRRISEAFDGVGAQSNAFTSKEHTCYWARLRDADLPLGIEVLAEMMQRPAFRPQDVESERQVVLEEINMNEDDPADVAHELFTQKLWSAHELGPPILGTKEGITELARDTIAGYWRRRYGPRATVMAVAGHLDHEEVVQVLGEYFAGWTGGPNGRPVGPVVPAAEVAISSRDTEQAHIVIGCVGLAADDKRRWALGVLNHVLGGGTSSRLFHEIREQRGLVYSVYSFRLAYSDTGALGVYAGTTPSQSVEVLHLITEQFAHLAQEGITDEELQRAKGHVNGSLALSLEDPGSRMSRLGRIELAGREHLAVDQIVAEVEAVTAADVQAVAEEVFSRPRVIGAAGPFDSAELEQFLR